MAADVPARFFVDENDLALGRSLATARKDVLHPGHPRLPEVPLGTPDRKWLRTVGTRGLVVITRDKRIRSRPREAQIVLDAGIRGFVLTSAGKFNTWDTLTLVVRQWEKLERYLDDHPSGPWLAALNRQGVRPLLIPGTTGADEP
jgi:hypothetical protein